MNLFIVAMKEEINLDVSRFEKILKNGLTFYLINSKNILLFSDVGKENALFSIVIALQSFKNINHVYNLGTAGSAKKDKKWFDIVIASKTQFLDIDFSPFNYKLNEIPRVGKEFKCDSIKTEEIKRLLSNNGFNSLMDGKIGTSDTFITNQNYKNFSDSTKVDCFDMESASLNFTCNKLQIPFNAIKILSDNIFCNNSTHQFKSNLSSCSNLLSKILNLIIDNF